MLAKEIWTCSLHRACTFTFLLSPDCWAGLTLLLPSFTSWIKLGAYSIHPATSQTKSLLSKEHSLHISHIFEHQDVSNASSHCQASVEAGSLCQTKGGGKLLSGCWGHVSLSKPVYTLHIGQLLVVSPPALLYTLLAGVFPEDLNPWYCMLETSQ